MFKTTREILKNDALTNIQSSHPSCHLPPRLDFLYDKQIRIKDIELWEEIYRQPGNIGIYIAWSPYAEFYMIVYELFLGTGYETETFYGQGAAESVFKKSKSLGIILEVQTVYTYPWHTPPFKIELN